MSNKSRFSSIEEVHEYFESKGSKFISVIDPELGEMEATDIPLSKVKVKYMCANNTTHIVTSTFQNVYLNNREKLCCRGCAISLASIPGGAYNKFITDLATKNWTCTDPKESYSNAMTLMNVICDNGHTTKISHNRFKNGHGCKQCDNDRRRKYDIKTISKEFEEKGYKLLDTVYTNNAIPLNYICKCGRHSANSYANFKRGHDGCKDCSRRWTIDDVKDFVEDNGCIFINADAEEFVTRESYITYTCFCGTDNTRTLFRSFREGTRCPNCVKEKIKQTSIDKYGVDNPAKSPIVKQKSIETNMEKRGVTHHMKLPEYKQKAKETNILNHNGTHNLNLPEIREKSNSKESTTKRKQTNKERYDTEWIPGSDHYKKVMLEKYNEEHPTHVPHLFEKQLHNAFKLKEYTTDSGKVFSIQGYENHALDRLFANGVNDTEIVTGTTQVPLIDYTFKDKLCKYYPDIYIPNKNKLIEVKSIYTYQLHKDKNDAKFDTCHDQGYDIECWIYDGKGKMVQKITYTKNTKLCFRKEN